MSLRAIEAKSARPAAADRRQLPRARALVVFGLLCLVSLRPAPTFASSPAGHGTGQLVVELKSGKTANALSLALSTLHWAVHASSSSHLAAASGLGDVVLVKPSGFLASALSVALSALALHPDVRAVQENVVIGSAEYGREQSQMPVFLDDLHLAQMRAQPAYLSAGIAPPPGPGGAGVRVAILDGGFTLGQEALVGRCTSGYDALDDDPNPQDLGNGIDDDGDGIVDGGVGHGTAVASLVAVSDPAARIVPVRVLDDEGLGTLYSVATGLRYALDAGAKVVNLSLGAPQSSGILEAALEAAESMGVLVVASAGNSGDDHVTYPGSSSHVLTVTGVAADGTRDPDASIGSPVDIAARSIEVVAPYPGTANGYGHWFGTSFSCALVSAAASRVLEASTAAPLSVGQQLLGAAAPFPPAASPDSLAMGHGILDASSLLP